jgi:F-type H+-transporting ATPase subunit b
LHFDLYTFFAQILNFIVLVILLYFLLFKKIIQAIDHKEKVIRLEFEQAEKEKKIAEEKSTQYAEKLRKFETEKNALFTQAQTEANQRRDELFEKAQSEIQEKRDKWERRLEEEKKEFLEDLQKKIGHEVYQTAEHVLKDIANVPLQAQIFQKFIEVVSALSDEQKKEFEKVYAQKEGGEIEIISSWELTEEERTQILKQFENLLGERPTVLFKEEEDHTLGINLFVNGYRLSWTTKNYFEWVMAKFDELLEKKNG